MAPTGRGRETSRPVLENANRRRLPLPNAGVEIALLDWGGDGPLALLHHANGFCAALWEPVAERLRRHYRVVAMDARGHGDSSNPEGESAYAWHQFGHDARTVGRALAAEHPDGRVALALGHSFGGTALMMAAAEDSALFDQLVMVDPVLHPRPTDVINDPERRERVGELAERARKRRQIFESRDEARATWSDKALFQNWTPRAFDLYLAEGLVDRPDGRVELKCPTSVESAIFGAGPDFDAWQVAPNVKTRTLLLWAERGDFPRSAYEGVAAIMADAVVRDVPAGHLVPMERPELVSEAVLDFVPSAAQRSTG